MHSRKLLATNDETLMTTYKLKVEGCSLASGLLMAKIWVAGSKQW